jgi:hypothetical protein
MGYYELPPVEVTDKADEAWRLAAVLGSGAAV